MYSQVFYSPFSYEYDANFEQMGQGPYTLFAITPPHTYYTHISHTNIIHIHIIHISRTYITHVHILHISRTYIRMKVMIMGTLLRGGGALLKERPTPPPRMCTNCWGSEAPPQRMCTNSWGSKAPPQRMCINCWGSKAPPQRMCKHSWGTLGEI